jgi:hypothetical protein
LVAHNGHALAMAGNSMNLSPEPSADKRNKSTENAQKLIKELLARNYSSIANKS